MSSADIVPQQNKLAQAALIYVKKFGWCVVPLHSIKNGCCTCGRAGCTSPGKHPLIPNGVKGASKDPTIVAGWWRRWPWANIGIATGAASGFFVLDVDGEAGEESLRELEGEHGQLPDTVEALTGSGGRHILFRYPGGPVCNKVALADGLDIRGDNGYIVAAPSLHVSGRRYCWEASSRPGEVALAEAPDWLLDMIKPAGCQGLSRTVEDWRELVSGGVAKGARNNAIAALAGYLFRKYVDPYVTLDLLLAWNEVKCHPPLPADEVATTVDSVARLEARRRGAKMHG